MIHRLPLGIGSALVLGLCLGATGCARAPAAAPAAAPISVTVSYPVERDVTDHAEFPARVAAVQSVQVRAHVWGYLDKIHFREGALVNKGDVLFEIDPRMYRADLERAKGAVAQYEAQMRRLEHDYERGRNLRARAAVSQEEYDRIEGDYRAAVANLHVAEANRDLAALNLEYTKVTAPVGGRISRYLVTVGNLIQSGDQGGGTVLTTIVSVDPMYAYFDVDELTVLRAGQLNREGKAASARETAVPVSLALANEEGFPHRGTINFVDNQINAKTGTLSCRGVFPNKDEALTAGFFARVRVPIALPHRALLVTDRALDNDQGQKILYVLNDKDEVVSRPVRVGALHDGLRAIEDGLKPGERVLVNGLLKVRPGMTVQPKLVDMPNPAIRSRTARLGDQGGAGARGEGHALTAGSPRKDHDG
jgi:RND family efflux transporter MFP subunit